MAKYGKRGNQGGSKGANRTGKTNPNARSHGEDVSKESHRTSTQKYGGHKSGPRNRGLPFGLMVWKMLSLICPGPTLVLNKSYSFIGLVFFNFIIIFSSFIFL